MRRLSLLTRFAVVSLALIALLGLLVTARLHGIIEHRSRANAEKMAALAVQLVGRSQPGVGSAPVGSTPRWAVGVLDPTVAQTFTAVLHSPQVRGQLLAVKAWTADGRIVYSDNPALIGSQAPLGSPGLRAALAGRLNSEVTDEAEEATRDAADTQLVREHGRLLEVFVPVRASADGPVRGGTVAALRTDRGGHRARLPHRRAAAAGRADGAVSGAVSAGRRRVFAAGAAGRRQRAAGPARPANRSAQPDPARPAHTERALAAADGTGRTVALLLLDLNGFKEINDTLGHPR